MTMQVPRSVRENLQFLIVEVDSQVARLQTLLAGDRPDLHREILDRRGYSGNLKNWIHNGCRERLAGPSIREADVPVLRCSEVIASDLDWIAERCRDCVEQVREIHDADCLQRDACREMLERVRGGIGMIGDALEARETRKALKIGQIQRKLDRRFRELQKHHVKALQHGENTGDLIRSLIVAYGIGRMGNALQSISEALIAASLGQSVSLESLQSLQATVANVAGAPGSDALELGALAETRSGSAVAGVRHGNPDGADYQAIFKHGAKRKLKEERIGVERWHEVYPGLAPEVYSFEKDGNTASLLIEHLPGPTFDKILLREGDPLLGDALGTLEQTLRDIWRRTRREQPAPVDFMVQLQKRLPDVWKLHPEFQRESVRLCGLQRPSFDWLVDAARELEAEIAAPFTVYIHGDFNLDNILYDPQESRVHFIDLRRSRDADYVQDVSVFMVSNYRLQILDRALRRRIMACACACHAMAARYAAECGDTSFDHRLALGLARSFMTSTRFILDKSLSRSMFLRARYLLELALSVPPGESAEFRLPVEALFSA